MENYMIFFALFGCVFFVNFLQVAQLFNDKQTQRQQQQQYQSNQDALEFLSELSSLKDSVRTTQLHQSRRLATVGPWREQDGLLVMEAEAVDVLDQHWLEETVVDGDDTITFLRFTGNQDKGGDPTGRLRYHFVLSTPGTYRIAMHAYKPLVGDRTDLSNDCYTRMVPYYDASGTPGTPDTTTVPYQAKDTKFYLGGRKANAWGWAVKHEYPQHEYVKTKYEMPQPGEYTLEVSGRSQNFRIDKIFMFEVGKEEAALDLSLPESSRVGGDPNTPPVYPIELKLMLVKANVSPVEKVRLLRDNLVVSLSKIGTSDLSLRCNAKDPDKMVDKVRFELGNGREKEDSQRPYTLSQLDSDDGAYKPVRYLSRTGAKTVTAKAIDAEGLVVGVASVAFTVEE